MNKSKEQYEKPFCPLLSGSNSLEFSHTTGITRMLVMRYIVIMLFPRTLTATDCNIMLQTKYFTVMMVRQDRCR